MGLIAAEIKQGRPFRSAGHEAAVSLLRTADVVRRAGARVIEPYGITLQQFNVLRILRGAGQGGLPTLEIAARMIEEAPGITRLLDRLERKALVKRQRCPRDRRRVLCTITSAGLRLLSALDAPLAATEDALMETLGPARAVRLVALLDVVRAAQGAAPPPARSGPSPYRPSLGRAGRHRHRTKEKKKR
jgi:DNA-binding MarR family transcriptional regulator